MAKLTLGAPIVEADSESGTIDVEVEAKDGFTNPVGNIQGGFLAAMIG
jgi:acyl-coenzyme A thioesterase PaaI-like protein